MSAAGPAPEAEGEAPRTFTIARLGAKGDGIPEGPGGLRFVPFTLPGERVAASGSGARLRLDAVLDAAPERVAPPCPHFGACGGCDLQHAGEALYRAFKRDLEAKALAREGVSADVAPLVPCAPASRRRCVLTAERGAEGRLSLGFLEAETHRLVAIEVCRVATPAIERGLPALRRLAAVALDLRRPLKLTVIDSASGLDVALADHAPLSEDVRRRIVALGAAEDFCRVSVAGGEVLVETRAPMVPIGGIAVAPPPGAFLQAVASAEAAMAGLVAGHLAGAKRVADLFSGVGTFALHLAPESAVHAVEAEAGALAALDAAARQAPRALKLKPVTLERRDLFRRPLAARELKPFDGLVFDPPRAGAEAQAKAIAASSVRRVAAVSCNPATLARDLSILLAGGYRLVCVTPLDQFLWSHHVEAVALLER